MNKPLRIAAWALLALCVLALVAALAAWYHVQTKQPQRSGALSLPGLTAPVQVRWDDYGVPHIEAQSEPDLFRALGYLHAQDRLFQMEVLRRLARGELAEVLGPKLVDTDRLMRTLGIRAHADAYAARELADLSRPANRALHAYLEGVNHYQATRPAPLEFDVLGIAKRPFTAADTMSVAGYMAYSFASAFRTEPVLSFVRDQLGAAYLAPFDDAWRTQGAVRSAGLGLGPSDWQGLTQLARLSQRVLDTAGIPVFEGSNAWAISGKRTASGKPLLAGDPHIAFAAPSVWWEAHLKAPGFELYGHHQALNPMALLGHNQRFGWSLTMFQNDDIDLIAEKTNPEHPNQVWHQGRWVEMLSRTETLRVKGGADVQLTLRRSPHGPIVNDAVAGAPKDRPIAMWWAFLEAPNPILQAFHDLARADTLPTARAAASKIHAPGLNVVWANAAGDIGWWAAAALPARAPGIDPRFILDGSQPASDTPALQPFSANPQEENPARGYVVSANHQPAAAAPVPGYYNLWDRAQRLDERLRQDGVRWDSAAARELQLDVQTGYAQRLLAPLLPLLRQAAAGAEDKALVDELAAWQGRHALEDRAPVLFHQFVYELTRAAMADELGKDLFEALARTRAIDHALPRLAADAASPWWDQRGTPAVEDRAQTVAAAWQATLVHLRSTFGADVRSWTWGRAHTLTHGHPLGRQKPLDKLFDVGPLPAPGAHETPNNLGQRMGPAPWAVVYGPSTRRVIDFADATQAVGINPVGQSGVLGDAHYADQARMHVRGQYRAQHLAPADVARHTRSQLVLNPQ